MNRKNFILVTLLIIGMGIIYPALIPPAHAQQPTTTPTRTMRPTLTQQVTVTPYPEPEEYVNPYPGALADVSAAGVTDFDARTDVSSLVIVCVWLFMLVTTLCILAVIQRDTQRRGGGK